MAEDTSDLVFKRRPKPVPGDLRIVWRMSVTLLALNSSRGKKASLAKLHIVNDALRNPTSREKLSAILANEIPLLSWRVRVEPAFSRNLDFMAAENLIEWLIANERSSLKLTQKGILAAKSLEDDDETLLEEKSFLKFTMKSLSEDLVRRILAASKVRV